VARRRETEIVSGEWPPTTLSEVITTDESGEGRCINCGSATECKSKRKCTIPAFRKKFIEPWVDYLELKETDEMGLGIFCHKDDKMWSKPTPSGIVVGEMTGNLRPPGWDYAKSGTGGYSVKFPIGNSRSQLYGSLDSYDSGSIMRFVNFSCDSNCEYQTGRVGKSQISTVVVKRGKTLFTDDEVSE
jgi:hypothetical protein